MRERSGNRGQTVQLTVAGVRIQAADRGAHTGAWGRQMSPGLAVLWSIYDRPTLTRLLYDHIHAAEIDAMRLVQDEMPALAELRLDDAGYLRQLLNELVQA